MNFIATREIDDLGRILLPIDMRKFYGIYPGDVITIKYSESEIVISKSEQDTIRSKYVDKQGRILIPKYIRKMFGAEGKITVGIRPQDDGIYLCLINTDIDRKCTNRSNFAFGTFYFSKK